MIRIYTAITTRSNGENNNGRQKMEGKTEGDVVGIGRKLYYKDTPQYILRLESKGR